jgi:hypothetical protein
MMVKASTLHHLAPVASARAQSSQARARHRTAGNDSVKPLGLSWCCKLFSLVVGDKS